MKTMFNLVSDRMLLCILLAAVTGVESSVLSQHGAGRISPAVPISDKKFFGKEYPNDKRVKADKYYVFDHPYPAVQDSGDFDTDFVKDENGDGGRWEAQMKYDTLRAKMQAARDKLKGLKEKMEAEYQEWQTAKKEAGVHTEKLTKAQKEVETTGAAAEAAAKSVNDLEGSSQKEGTSAGGAIGRAVKDVKKEMDDLEKCKEALAKAKERLKELIKQQADHKVAQAKAEKEEKVAAEKAAAEAKKQEEVDKKEEEKQKEEDKKEDEKAAKEDKKAKKAHKKRKADAQKKKKDWEKEIKEDTQDLDDSKKDYQKQKDDVSSTQRQLEEAAENLKKFRRPPYVDGDGGVYNVPSKSSAIMASSPVALGMMGLAVVVASFA